MQDLTKELLELINNPSTPHEELLELKDMIIDLRIALENKEDELMFL